MHVCITSKENRKKITGVKEGERKWERKFTFLKETEKKERENDRKVEVGI